MSPCRFLQAGYISRMIKNAAWLAIALVPLALSGCERAAAQGDQGFQGVVEFDQTLVSFELGGKVKSLNVKEGDSVDPGAALASLDDELSRKQLEARAADAESARAEVSRVRSGSRREDVSAMAARVEAARASEALLTKNLARQRTLLEKNVIAQASLDETEAQLARATAERQSLEQNLLALRHGARREEVAVAESRVAVVEASLALERERLERFTVAAPMGGEVLDVHVELGEVVGAGAPVVTLGDTAHPYVDVFVPQGKLAGVAVGNAARVRVDAERENFAGKVEHVAQKTEFTPRFLFSERERPNLVVRVRVRVDDPQHRLHAGVPAFVTMGPKPASKP